MANRINNIITKRKSAITITFGDQAENHKGMQIIGKMSDHGFTNEELLKTKDLFEREGCHCDYIDLKEKLETSWNNLESIKIDDASVLIIRGGINHILSKVGFDADYIFEEQSQLNVDKKAFMYGRVVEKSARYNLCFDETEQEPDYENKKGRIISYYDVPLTRYIRHMLPSYFGPKGKNLAGEGNYYFDASKCGIGWHGDSERKKVIAMRLGVSIPLAYQWYHRRERVGNIIRFDDINHGDLYVMSEKATGFDWKRKNIPTLRHSAGSKKYLDFK